MLFNKQPSYQSFKIFDCLCFPCLRKYNAHKLNLRFSPCTFLGYTNNIKGYKCLDNKGRIFISSHVVFNENVFPFNENEIKTTQRISNSKFSIPPIPLNHEEIMKLHEENQLNDPGPQLTIFNPETDHESTSSQLENEDNSTNHPIVPTTTGHHKITREKSGIFKPKVYNANLDIEEPCNFPQAIQSENGKQL